MKEIEVDGDDWKKADYPDILHTILGPCIGIGIFDPKTRSGYMIHSTDFYVLDNLDSFLNIIQEDYKDLSRLRLCVVGNSLLGDDPQEVNECSLKSRSYVEDQLPIYFNKSQIDFQWALNDVSVDFVLDTSTGDFSIKYEDIKCMDDIIEQGIRDLPFSEEYLEQKKQKFLQEIRKE
ncbi:MAG: hypothetical protein V3V78_03205 [Candidatus Woesearchaeota archaeon]